ncbi:MAG: OmpA family protein [Spirochaetota bacterium]|nr:OmpA family protein [Spirochaetota bacterium]
MSFKIAFLSLVLLIAPITLQANQLFRFQDKAGDQYTIRTFSLQEVLYNNVQIGIYDLKYLGRLSILSTGKKGSQVSGKYYYFTKPHRSTRKYALQNKYNTSTRFFRKPNGIMTIASNTFFPVVRHVPTFPAVPVEISKTWSATGEEAQDLRALGLTKPYILPFRTDYRYLKNESFRGRHCAIIEVRYLINHNSNRPIGKRPSKFPARVKGYFKGKYYWDLKNGHPVFYEGTYDFIYVLLNGEICEFKGIEYGDVTKHSRKPLIAKEKPKSPKGNNAIARDLEKSLKDQNLNFPIKKTPKKITINLGELLFDFNSHTLKKDTIRELDKLARLLMKYDHYNLTVEGHTDSIGKSDINQRFSEQRARNVRDYLVQKGVSPNSVRSKGFGAKKPVDSNTTPAGRSKNRRVEITIHVDEPVSKPGKKKK